MTAAKEMNVIARLPDCAGQAADAVSACTQLKMEDVPKLQKHPKKIPSESVQIYGYVFHDTSGQNLGQTLKTQCFLLNEICTDIHLLASFWEDGSWKFYWDVDRKKYQIGNVCVCIESRDDSFPHTWMTKRIEGSRIWIPCGKMDQTCRSWRASILSGPRVFGK